MSLLLSNWVFACQARVETWFQKCVRFCKNFYAVVAVYRAVLFVVALNGVTLKWLHRRLVFCIRLVLFQSLFSRFSLFVWAWMVWTWSYAQLRLALYFLRVFQMLIAIPRFFKLLSLLKLYSLFLLFNFLHYFMDCFFFLVFGKPLYFAEGCFFQLLLVIFHSEHFSVVF